MEQGLSVELYDRMYPPRLSGTPVEGDIRFYLSQARQTGGPILELGCGTGRVALPLANRGFEVTGLDVSPYMLRVIRRKAQALPPKGRLRLVRGNMARFNLHKKFRLILIPFRAFQHLYTVEAQKACLRCVYRHLRTGGRFILDVFDPRLESCLPSRRRPSRLRERYRDESGRRITVRSLHRLNDPLRQILQETWEFTVRNRQGKVVRRSKSLIAMRWTYRYEMQHLLELTGFRILAGYGDFKGGRPRYGAEQIWVATNR